MFCWYVPHLFAIAPALMIDRVIQSGCTTQPLGRSQPEGYSTRLIFVDLSGESHKYDVSRFFIHQQGILFVFLLLCTINMFALSELVNLV